MQRRRNGKRSWRRGGEIFLDLLSCYSAVHPDHKGKEEYKNLLIIAIPYKNMYSMYEKLLADWSTQACHIDFIFI